jgi:hypothetical protein
VSHTSLGSDEERQRRKASRDRFGERDAGGPRPRTNRGGLRGSEGMGEHKLGEPPIRDDFRQGDERNQGSVEALMNT